MVSIGKMSSTGPGRAASRRPRHGKEAATSAPPNLRQIAAGVFGYTALRPGQEQAAAALAAGRDCLAVMPSGGYAPSSLAC